MPVRAPVTEPEAAPSGEAEGKTSDAKSASLEPRFKEHGHASVRVGSAAMPAPFAVWTQSRSAARVSPGGRANHSVKEHSGVGNHPLVVRLSATPKIV